MSGVLIVSLLIGVLVATISFAGFLRSLFLLREAREDLLSVGSATPGVVIMYRFFVKANFIHLTKLVITFIGAVSIIVPVIDGSLVYIRLYSTPFVILAVVILSFTLGELEAHARRNVKSYYRKQYNKREVGR